jgi:hypothetical protein
VAKLVRRVKLVAELEPGLTTERELARLERDDQAGLADLGLRLAEVKQFTAANIKTSGLLERCDRNGGPATLPPHRADIALPTVRKASVSVTDRKTCPRP